MALTDDQRAYLDSKIGPGYDEADIEVRLVRLNTVAAVVREVLEIRLATLISQPSSFTVPGEYSQDTRENIKVLREALRDAKADEIAGSDVDENLVYIQSPYATRLRVPDTEENRARLGQRGSGR